jgi:hypothetical protein
VIQVNIWVALEGIGIESDATAVPYHVIFQSEKLRESKRFNELWRINCSWTPCRRDDAIADLAG